MIIYHHKDVDIKAFTFFTSLLALLVWSSQGVFYVHDIASCYECIKAKLLLHQVFVEIKFHKIVFLLFVLIHLSCFKLVLLY